MKGYKKFVERPSGIELSEGLIEYDWSEFYGAYGEPVTSMSFSRLHFMPKPSMEMLDGNYVLEGYLQTIEQVDGTKLVTAEQECNIKFDEGYIGHYLSIIFAQLGVTDLVESNVNEDVLELDTKGVVAKYGKDKKIAQMITTYRDLIVKAKAIKNYYRSISIGEYEAMGFINQFSDTPAKYQKLLAMYKTNPLEFAKIRTQFLNLDII